MSTDLFITDKMVCLDAETTGVDTQKDKIIQLALYVQIGTVVTKHDYFFNPQMPIPADSTAVHGITDEMVKDKPLFAELAPEIIEVLKGAIISGYNIKQFDIPILQEEFKRCGIEWTIDNDILDVYLMDKKLNPRSLGNVFKQYMFCEMENAHDAMGDVLATVQLLGKMITVHGSESLNQFLVEQRKMLDLDAKFKYDANGMVVFNFGKHIDQLCSQHNSYVQWMLGQDSFKESTKIICRRILKGEFTTAHQQQVTNLENAEVDPFA